MRIWFGVLAIAAVCGGAAAAHAQGLTIRIPEKAFGDMPSPPAPDYSQPQNWAALPGRLDAADVVPANDAFGDRQASAGVDVFYIHPTTYRDIAFWNQPLDDAKVNAWTDESVIARQASVFNACCRVFAPRYRQAASAAVYAPPAKNPMAAYDLAWQDVRAAFLYYLKHYNKGRPFIIAGHSQGGAHTQRWLEEFARDPRLRARLVAAYAIGIAFPEGLVTRSFNGVGLCRTPGETGCMVTWNTFAQGGDPAMMVGSSQKRYADKYQTQDGLAILCVNPLSFDLTKMAVPASSNFGSLPASPGVGAVTPASAPEARLPATEAGRLGAACEGGVLFVDAPPKEGYAVVALPAGMLHFNDFDLFYQNIRLNAVARADAWMAAHVRR